jgi:outer membrane lipoprotein-sorting protein
MVTVPNMIVISPSNLFAMNKILQIPLLLLFSVTTTYCQEVLNEGIIEMKVLITFPERESVPSPEGGGNMMRFGDMDMKSKMYFKNGNMKVENETGMGKNLTFYHADTKITTTLMEMMGKKMGFYSNEEEMKKMMSGNDSSKIKIQSFKPETFIEYLSESKVIAGFTCYKAIIRYKNSKGEELQQILWYSPEFRMGEGLKLGSFMRSEVPGMNKLKGFPMEMESTQRNGMKIQYEVTKIDKNARIDDKTFEIPKGYDIKPQSEMMRGGNFQFRVGG